MLNDTLAAAVWRPETVYPGLDSPEFESARETIRRGLDELAERQRQHGVEPESVDSPAATSAGIAEILDLTGALMDQVEILEGYLYMLLSTGTDADQAAAKLNWLGTAASRLRQLRTHLDVWAAAHEDAFNEPAIAERAGPYFSRRAQGVVEHRLSAGEEELFQTLRGSGGLAWETLYGSLTGPLNGILDGSEVSMNELTSLAFHQSRERRRAAYRAELDAWQQVEVPLAACLNGVKGEVLAVSKRRGWPDPLAAALWENRVGPATLSAMHEAMEAALPAFRRFLGVKASLIMGDADGERDHLARQMPWWDLHAPAPGPAGQLGWEETLERIDTAFASCSGELARLARRALEHGWVDALPRANKWTGGFTAPIGGDESRILVNFDGSWRSARELAHELGHAYHVHCLAGLSGIRRESPMVLAETASVFCETLFLEDCLGRASPEQRLAPLDTILAAACMVLVDTHGRFLFERSVFERLASESLTPAQLCELMVDAQKRTYGDALDLEAPHPYLWAAKSHFFMCETPYYNWPYYFGLLFALGLYAQYRRDPEWFRPSFDRLLASTGDVPPAELARRFDCNINSVGFWSSSLDVLTSRIPEYTTLVESHNAARIR